MWKPGEAASLKQRLSLYLFILLFLLSIRQEGGGRGAAGGRGGAGRVGRVCVRVVRK